MGAEIIKIIPLHFDRAIFLFGIVFDMSPFCCYDLFDISIATLYMLSDIPFRISYSSAAEIERCQTRKTPRRVLRYALTGKAIHEKFILGY